MNELGLIVNNEWTKTPEIGSDMNLKPLRRHAWRLSGFKFISDPISGVFVHSLFTIKPNSFKNIISIFYCAKILFTVFLRRLWWIQSGWRIIPILQSCRDAMHGVSTRLQNWDYASPGLYSSQSAQKNCEQYFSTIKNWYNIFEWIRFDCK